MTFQHRAMRRRAAVALGAAVVAAGGILTAGASAAGLASESPRQIEIAIKSALAGAKSFEMHFVIHKPSGATESATFTTDANGGLYVKASLQSGQSFALIVLSNHRAYFRASTKFWTSHGVSDGLARVLAPKWYKYPSSAALHVKKSLGNFSPSTFSQCLAPTKTAGSGWEVTPGSFDGRPVVIIKSSGTQPGTARGRLAIASKGKAYPLHMVITGPTKPGGSSKRSCGGGGSGGNFTGTVTMSHWNSTPAIKAPAGAIKLPNNS